MSAVTQRSLLRKNIGQLQFKKMHSCRVIGLLNTFKPIMLFYYCYCNVLLELYEACVMRYATRGRPTVAFPPPHHPLLGYYLIQYPIHLKQTRITACYCFKKDHLKWHNKQGLSQLTVQGAASVRCCRVCLCARCAAIPPTLYCTCHVPP